LNGFLILDRECGAENLGAPVMLNRSGQITI